MRNSHTLVPAATQSLSHSASGHTCGAGVWQCSCAAGPGSVHQDRGYTHGPAACLSHPTTSAPPWHWHSSPLPQPLKPRGRHLRHMSTPAKRAEGRRRCNRACQTCRSPGRLTGTHQVRQPRHTTEKARGTQRAGRLLRRCLGRRTSHRHTGLARWPVGLCARFGGQDSRGLQGPCRSSWAGQRMRCLAHRIHSSSGGVSQP